MENYSFKTAAFGGFDRQDVVRYLEQSAEKSAALQREHEQEVQRLRSQAEELSARVEALQKQVDELSAQRDQLQSRLTAETAARESLRGLEQDVTRLTAEADALRPGAEAYARFRMRLGDIECEARNRAEDLEEAAAAQTRLTAETFQSQYRKLMDTFSAAAGNVTRELETLQEALVRLPRNMDETGTALDELVRCLQGSREDRMEYLTQKTGRTPPEAAENLPEDGPLQEEGPEPFRGGQSGENG